jgi:hypothetical protein
LLQGISSHNLALRYYFHLNVFFMTLVWLGATRWSDIVSAAPLPRVRLTAAVDRPAVRAAVSGSILLALLGLELNPLESLKMTSDDLATVIQSASWRRFKSAYSDQKAVAQYVRERLGPGDLIVAMNWLSQYDYIGRTDYWLRSSRWEHEAFADDGAMRDIYTGAVVVQDPQGLERVVLENASRRIWIVTCQWSMRDERKVSPALRSYLDGLEDHVVFAAGDGSKVYLLNGRRPGAEG